MKTLIIFVITLFYSILYAQSPAPVQVTVRNPSGKAIPRDKVFFVGQKSKRTISGTTNELGKFTVLLPQGDVYDIRIETIGDEMEYNTLEVPKIPEGAEFEPMDVQITYQPASSMVVAGIHFQTGSDQLEAGCSAVLDEIAEYLKRKADQRIEISGHTDADGEANQNLLLSQKRAEAVKRYLISKGVSAARLSAVGYGETKPVASNDTAEGRAKNRRTEIKIL